MKPNNDLLIQRSISASKLDINQATLKPESLYGMKPLSNINLQQSIHISKLDINRATLKPLSPRNLKDFAPKADNETDVDVRAAAAMCQYAYHALNETKNKKAKAELIDGWEPMNESEVNKLVGSGFHLKLKDATSGFSSMLFQKQTDDIPYYAYCTEGTEMSSFKDWSNNLSQAFFFGISRQYSCSVSNAKKIDAAVGNNAVLWFIGHSLGGGLASNNSLVTGRHAITFNAAGLNTNRVTFTLLWNNWKDLFHPIKRSQRVHAFVLEGEILNTASWWIGQSAYGDKKTIKMKQQDIGRVDRHSLTTILDNLGMKYE